MALNEELSGEGQNAAHFQSRVPARISRPGSRSTKAAATTLHIARGEFNVRGSTDTPQKGIRGYANRLYFSTTPIPPPVLSTPRCPKLDTRSADRLDRNGPLPVPQGLPSYLRRPTDVRHI